VDWNDIVVKSIEHGFWPLTFLVITIIIISNSFVKDFISSLSSLSVGGFSLALRKSAEEKDVFEEFKTLKSLTMNQLHLYLVIGGEGADETIYKSKISSSEFASGFEKLNNLGLIRYSNNGSVLCFENTKKVKYCIR